MQGAASSQFYNIHIIHTTPCIIMCGYTPYPQCLAVIYTPLHTGMCSYHLMRKVLLSILWILMLLQSETCIHKVTIALTIHLLILDGTKHSAFYIVHVELHVKDPNCRMLNFCTRSILFFGTQALWWPKSGQHLWEFAWHITIAICLHPIPTFPPHSPPTLMYLHRVCI